MRDESILLVTANASTIYRIVPNIQSFTFLTKHEKGLSNEIHKVRNI